MPQLSQDFISWTNLEDGWNDREDPTKSSGLRVMENVFITDRGGVAPRPGTELFATSTNGTSPVKSIHTSIKRSGENVMLWSNDTYLHYYNTDTNDAALLKANFTDGQVFGYADHNINTDTLDYVYFCNAIEPYQRWTLAFDKTTAALAGGETAIPVGSTLLDNVYYTGTATGSTDTTITVASAPWAADIWNSGFYVYITAGALQGRVSPISATTSTQITFTAIAGLAGTVTTFEIRRLKFPASGTVIINSSTVAYTQIINDDELPVTSAPAAADDSPVAAVPEELLSNSCPRGNILRVLFQTMFVSGTKENPSTIYRSNLQDAADFTFSSPRVAGEGDVIDIPEGGGQVNDMEVFEDKLIALKKSYIEQITFTQDANDLPNRLPLVNSPLIGTDGRVFKMSDDIVFANPSNEITTVARAKTRDVRPFASNLAWPIKRAIRNFDFNTSRGKTFRNYTFEAAKESSDSETNDVAIVYDNNRQKWIGKWLLPVADFTVYNNELYFGSSGAAEVYKMFGERNATIKGEDAIAYDTLCETQWVNKTKSGFGTQAFDIIAITGYIRENTKVSFGLYYDFANEATHSWVFDPLESPNQVLESSGEMSLGNEPLGVTPLGVEIGEEEGDFGEKRFVIYYRLPITQHIWTKLQWSSTGVDQYYEITDISANFTQIANNPIQKYMKSIEEA